MPDLPTCQMPSPSTDTLPRKPAHVETHARSHFLALARAHSRPRAKTHRIRTSAFVARCWDAASAASKRATSTWCASVAFRSAAATCQKYQGEGHPPTHTRTHTQPHRGRRIPHTQTTEHTRAHTHTHNTRTKTSTTNANSTQKHTN